MEFRKIPRPCFHCRIRQRDHLFFKVQRGPITYSFVTAVCECQKGFIDDRNDLGLQNTWWSSEMIESFVRLIESGSSWHSITESLNSSFGTTLTGRQRPKGKGYDGAVVKKWDNLRIASCEWDSSDSDDVLMRKAFEAFKHANSERSERGFVPVVKRELPLAAFESPEESSDHWGNDSKGQ